jgi:hypothetical protein
MGEYWQDDLERMHNGMLLLGWRADHRLTSEDEAMITPLVERAISLNANGRLTPDDIDSLSLEVYRIASFQIMNTEERAKLISGAYSRSTYLSPAVPLIDQATCCFYRRYHTSSLATLFIVVESYLRNLLGWQPGHPDPTFAQLRSAVNLLPECRARDEAAAVLNAVYVRFDAQNPPQFYFNRHGLLHGIRPALGEVDEMNCVRIYLLMDLLCAAERLYTGGYVFDGGDDVFYRRNDLFRKCALE